jgi:helix-turn-helix protein
VFRAFSFSGKFLPQAKLFRKMSMVSTNEYFCRIPASLVKDAERPPAAKLLYLVVAAHADSRTGKTYIGLRTLERWMDCKSRTRQEAQQALVKSGRLRLERRVCSEGRWGKQIFTLILPAPATTGHFKQAR